MPGEILHAIKSDYHEIVDFLNYVFCYTHRKMDFPQMLPKLFREEAFCPDDYYLVKKDGKIIAAAGAYPLKASIMGKEYKVAGIGNVAVHPYCQGSGYMTAIMNAIVADLKRTGEYAFAFLGGMRQRYETFGFETCGSRFEFIFTRDNLRHNGRNQPDDITYIPMEKGQTDNIRKAQELQQKQPMYCIREPAGFYNICKSWNSNPYIILKNNEFLGYAVSSADLATISEIGLCDSSKLSGVIQAYYKHYQGKSLKLHLAPFDHEKISSAQSFCENMSICYSENLNVFDFEDVIRQLFLLKMSYSEICDGQMILEIKDYGRLCIQVENQQANIAPTDASANLTLSHLEAMSFLFSPAAAQYWKGRRLGSHIGSWFPLPICWSLVDAV